MPSHMATRKLAAIARAVIARLVRRGGRDGTAEAAADDGGAADSGSPGDGGSTGSEGSTAKVPRAACLPVLLLALADKPPVAPGFSVAPRRQWHPLRQWHRLDLSSVSVRSDCCQHWASRKAKAHAAIRPARCPGQPKRGGVLFAQLAIHQQSSRTLLSLVSILAYPSFIAYLRRLLAAGYLLVRHHRHWRLLAAGLSALISHPSTLLPPTAASSARSRCRARCRRASTALWLTPKCSANV